MAGKIRLGWPIRHRTGAAPTPHRSRREGGNVLKPQDAFISPRKGPSGIGPNRPGWPKGFMDVGEMAMAFATAIVGTGAALIVLAGISAIIPDSWLDKEEPAEEPELRPVGNPYLNQTVDWPQPLTRQEVQEISGLPPLTEPQLRLFRLMIEDARRSGFDIKHHPR